MSVVVVVVAAAVVAVAAAGEIPAADDMASLEGY